MKHVKKLKTDPYTRKKAQLMKTISEGTQMLDSADKDFKAAITDVFKDFKVKTI